MPYPIINPILETLLHSIWQMGLLFIFYKLSDIVLKNKPLAKRNFLYMLLLGQLFFSIISFINLYSNQPLVLQVDENLGAVPAWFSFSENPVLAPLLFYSYAAIVFYKGSQLLFNQRRERNFYKKNFIAAPAYLKALLKRISVDLNVRINIVCSAGEALVTPFVYGILKPTIVFPVALLNSLSTEETEALLCHELAHIRHQDYLLNLFLVAGEIIFFFNPFMHLIASEIKLEREKACDEKVLSSGLANEMYAMALYKIALPVSYNKLHLTASGNNQHLLHRLHLITGQKKFDRKKNWLQMAATVFLILATAFVALVQSPKQEQNIADDSALQQPVNMLFPIAGKIDGRSEITPAITTEGLSLKDAGEYEEILQVPAEAIEEPFSTLNEQLEIDPPIEEFPVKDINITYAAYSAQPAVRTQTIFIEEEKSGGQKTLTAITITLVNDSIVSTPMWQIEKLPVNIDTTISLRQDSMSTMH